MSESTFTDLAILAEFIGTGSFTAAGSITYSASAHFSGATSITATPGSALPGAATFASNTSIVALGHLAGDPNYFPQVTCQFDVNFAPGNTNTIGAQATMNFDVNFLPTARVRGAETYNLDLIVDIVAPEETAHNIGYVYELRINGSTVIPIKSFSYNEPKGEIGTTLSFELADVGDINAILNATEFRFRIGKVISGVTTWKTMIDKALLNGAQYTLSRGQFAPETEFQFSNRSAISDKLTRGPSRDLVLYDPSYLTVNLADFEVIYDTEGNEIDTELVARSGLTLYKILDEILVGRLGFSGIVSNLPDYVVKRIDFSFTSTYISAISGLIGMFEPLIFEYNGQIWIIDTTSVLPSGFPVTTEVKVDSAKSIRVNHQPVQKIDAYLLTYTEDGLNWDYYTERSETLFKENGTFGTSNYTTTEINRTIREYRTFARPTVVVKSDVIRDRRETSNYLGNTVGRTIEEYTYDGLGRQSVSSKSQFALVPNLPDSLLILREIRNETITVQYAADPFQKGRQIAQTVWTTVSGLIAVNNDSPQLGVPFRQDFMVAYQSGNLVSSMTLEFGEIKKTTEILVPVSLGQMQLETVVHDFILNTITTEKSEPKVGDFSISAFSAKQKKVKVPWTSPAQITRSFPIGEVPLQVGIALALRKLRRSNNGIVEASVDIANPNLNLRRGLPVAIKDLTNTTLAVCMVEGFTIAGSLRQLTTTIEGIQIG